MTWVAVGVTAAGTVKGVIDSNSARQKQADHDKYRKAAIQFSPWTGMSDPGAGNFGNTDALSGALGGGLQGFAMGSQINALSGAGGGTLADTKVDGNAGNNMAVNYQGQNKSPWAGMNKPDMFGKGFGQNNMYGQQKYMS